MKGKTYVGQSRRVFLLSASGLALLPLPVFAGYTKRLEMQAVAAPGRQKIFGVFFFPNGYQNSADWIPTNTGRDDAWQLSRNLSKLSPYKDSVSVATGFRANPSSEDAIHIYGPAYALCGGPPNGANAPSATIDSLAASGPLGLGADGKANFFRQLYISSADGPSANEHDAMYRSVSWSGATAPNSPYYDSRELFEAIYGKDLSGSKPVSILDNFTADIRQIERDLSGQEKERLQAYVDGIRTLEQRLTQGSTRECSGTRPNPDLSAITDVIKRDQLNHEVKVQLLVNALSCGLTRVFCYSDGKVAANKAINHRFSAEVGDENFHLKVTHEKDLQPGTSVAQIRDVFKRAIDMQMERLGFLIGAFKTAGLLDATSIFATSCTAIAKGHTGSNYPALLIGKGGGSLKGNVHFAPSSKLPVSAVAFTAAQAAGAGLASFGQNQFKVSEPLSDF